MLHTDVGFMEAQARLQGAATEMIAAQNALRERITDLDAQLAIAKSQLAAERDLNASLTTSLGDLSTKYEADKQAWKSFKEWWDDAVAAKQQRASARKKPRLSDHERAVLDSANLATPDVARIRSARSAVEPLQDTSTAVRAPPMLSRQEATDDKTDTPQTSKRPSGVQSAMKSVDMLSTFAPKAPAQSETNSSKPDPTVRVQRWIDQLADQSGEAPFGDFPSPLNASLPRERPKRSRDEGKNVNHPQASHEVLHNNSPLHPLEPPNRNKSHLPNRSQSIRIKAESDDETNRHSAQLRQREREYHSQTSAVDIDANTPQPQQQEVSLEELRQRRRREMEDLKRDPTRYRGRGRYALVRHSHLPGPSDAGNITAHFELIPELNGGVDYEHTDVVRDKQTRKQMHAYDCHCCKGYWDAVGRSHAQASSSVVKTIKAGGNEPTPLRPSRGLDYQLHSPRQDAEQDRHGDNIEGRQGIDIHGTPHASDHEEEEQSKLADGRRQRAGRHRAWGRPAATPEGYW